MIQHKPILIVLMLAPAARADVSYVREVQPILSRNCFACHGPDDGQREADLRLDVRQSAIESGAVVPKQPAKSELLRRVMSHDADERMPPPEHGKPLSKDQIEILRQWIEQGAPVEKHWAFVLPQQPPLPEVSDRQWARNAIDHFVLERLEANDERPSPDAEPYVLARRLYLDLLGRAPTPEEADAFVHDTSLRAYERLVDRLLASPQYGERWARPWLDLARYSDTNGYEKDRERSIWPYRDWIIRSLNADMPYDQFSVEQLAGDMLPDATSSQRVATGFHRNTMLNEEGGIDPLEFRFYAMVDRVATTGLVWMGLTTGCAQCHTHKYDPITHTDYYSFMALLNNADEPDWLVRDKATTRRREAILAEIDLLERQLPSQFPVDPASAPDAPESERRRNHLQSQFDAWVSKQQGSVSPWEVIRPVRFSTNLPRLEILQDGSLFSTGDITKRDVFQLEFDLSQVNLSTIGGLRLEVIPDERLPAGGPGRAFYEGRKGDFFLSEIDAVRVTDSDERNVEFTSPSHSYGKLSIGSGSAAANNVIDDEGSTGWSTSGQEGQPNQLVLPLKNALPADGLLKITMLFERHFAASLGRFRFSATVSKPSSEEPSDDESAIAASTLPVEIEAILAKPRESWTDRENEQVFRHFLRVTPLLVEPRRKIQKLRDALPEFASTMVLLERPSDNPRPTHRHHRGEYLSPKEPVAPTIPQFLEEHLGDTPPPSDRLEFARWLVSRRNPLAARVAVNRAWRHFWGHGLVRTSGDFGTQSEPPTHPELLDHLAVQWMAHDWSLKWLHREIVTSAAYRQQSRATPKEFTNDPTNRRLARGPRVRLDAEVIRDTVLAAADLLTTRIGGRSVFPPQPKSVVQLAYGNVAWNESKGADRYRRSLYTFSKRTAPFAAYLVFDAPSGETCVARRNRSNTPLQSLTLLNDPMFLEATKALGQQAAQRDGSRDSRAAFVFRSLLTRPPTKPEQDALVAYYERQLDRLNDGDLKAERIGGPGASPEAAAWSMVARVVMNVDEFVSKQ